MGTSTLTGRVWQRKSEAACPVYGIPPGTTLTPATHVALIIRSLCVHPVILLSSSVPLSHPLPRHCAVAVVASTPAVVLQCEESVISSVEL